MRKLNRGQELTKSELLEIRNNLIISKHARERLVQRNDSIKHFMETLEKPFLAYFNTDGSINIAPNNWQCYIVSRGKFDKDKFVLVTYKEEVWVSMKNKQKMAQKGIDRIGI